MQALQRSERGSVSQRDMDLVVDLKTEPVRVLNLGLQGGGGLGRPTPALWVAHPDGGHRQLPVVPAARDGYQATVLAPFQALSPRD